MRLKERKEIQKLVDDIQRQVADLRHLGKLYAEFTGRFKRVTQLRHCAAKRKVEYADVQEKLIEISKRLQKLSK